MRESTSFLLAHTEACWMDTFQRTFVRIKKVHRFMFGDKDIYNYGTKKEANQLKRLVLDVDTFYALDCRERPTLPRIWACIDTLLTSTALNSLYWEYKQQNPATNDFFTVAFSLATFQSETASAQCIYGELLEEVTAHCETLGCLEVFDLADSLSSEELPIEQVIATKELDFTCSDLLGVESPMALDTEQKKFLRRLVQVAMRFPQD